MRLGSHHRTQAATSCDMEFSAEDLVAATEITGGFCKRQCSQIPQVATIGSMAESPLAGTSGWHQGRSAPGGARYSRYHRAGDSSEPKGASGLTATLEGIVHFDFIRQG